jgi:hypothetical protein
LKKEKNFANVECRKNFNDTVRFLVEHYPNVGFTKCKVKRVVNLFEDTGSVSTIAGKKVGHQISVSFEKFDVVQALLSFF